MSKSDTRLALPSKRAIRRHWAERLVEIGKFDSVYEVMVEDYCFACGCLPDSDSGTHKAHILAHTHGGTEELENLHLLCRYCHRSSEFISGEKYWYWLKERTFLDVGMQYMSECGVNLAAVFAKLTAIKDDPAKIAAFMQEISSLKNRHAIVLAGDYPSGLFES